MKRAKNAEKNQESKVTTSEDRKKHEEAKNAVSCSVCMQGFPRTVRQPELEQHIDSKHAKVAKGKPLTDFFPTWSA